MDSDSGHGEKLEMIIDKDRCIRCEKGGTLLICSDVDCPISYHKECMPPQTLSISSMEDFYCPYCSYRKASMRTSKKKENVLLAMKNLSLFLGYTCPNTTSQKQEGLEGASRPIILGETSSNETAMHLDADVPIVRSGQLENDQVGEPSSDETAKHLDADVPIVRSGQLENDQVGEMSSDETAKHLDADVPIVRSGQLENDQEVERAIQGDDQWEADDPNIPHDDDKRREMQEHDLPQSSRLRKRKLNSPKEKDEIDTLKQKKKHLSGVEKRGVEHKDKTISLRRTRRTSVGHGEEVIKEPSLKVEHNEKTTASSSESKPNLLPREKRRKCLWSVEEEEMLKLGVEKFSTKINKNIPWMKLLEFGRDVFDSSRNSRDLKDKWRNLLAAKEQPPPEK